MGSGPARRRDVLAKGDSITLTHIECDTYDIKVVDEDGDECVIEEVDLCRDNRLEDHRQGSCWSARGINPDRFEWSAGVLAGWPESVSLSRRRDAAGPAAGSNTLNEEHDSQAAGAFVKAEA